ncbi:MAG: MFS transporter [Flavobacteriales bacterium]
MKSITTLIQNAYGGLSREVWLLSFTQFINRSGTMVIFFLSVYLKEELHMDLTRVGIAMAAFGLGSVVGVYAGGRLTDGVGAHRVMRWSLSLGAVLFVAVSFLESFVPLCIGLFLLSAVGDAFRPANMASMFFYSTPETYTRSVSLNRLAINLGFSFGPALGGLLAAVNYQYIFWADGITCLMAALIILLFIPKREKEKTNHETKGVKVQSPWQDKIYLLFLPLSVLYALTFFQFFSTMQLYYTEVEKFSELKIGALLGLNGLLIAAIEMIMIYKIEKRTTPYNFIALGAWLVVVSYLMLLAVSGWWWMVVLTIIMSFSEMFAMPFMMALMNGRSNADNKGRYASLYGMSWSAGQILCPLVATQTIANAGYNALWVILAALAMSVALGIKWLERKASRG